MSYVDAFFRARAARQRPKKRTAPRLELLENRRLLATFYPVPSAVDGAANSLRAAVISADENSQDNTIVLGAGTYRLTLPNTGGPATGGDLYLASAGHNVIIQGQGAGQSIIDGGGLDRVFEVTANVSVVMRGLTIQGGMGRDGGEEGPPALGLSVGGGILNEGTLTLDGVIVQNCVAAGAPGQDGTSGSLTVPASNGNNALGGGIDNEGTLTINQSLISGNQAEGGKGGDGPSTNNANGTGGYGGAALGGGIYNDGTLSISQSAVTGNDCASGAGGNGGSYTVGFGPSGGSGGEASGGGLYLDKTPSSATIIDSTIAANLIAAGEGGTGGRTSDIFHAAGVGGNGGLSEGGGIFAMINFSLYNSTIAANRIVGSLPGPAGSGGGGEYGNPGLAGGGGIYASSYSDGPGYVNSSSTIIALNATAAFNSTFEPDDMEGAFALSGVTNTLLGYGGGAATITNGVAGDIVGVDPKLGPLQDNGGPTPTMALLPGSPAIDAGSNPLGLTSDQREYSPRVVGAAADIGAYELGANAPPGGGGGTGGGGGGIEGGTQAIQATIVKIKGHRAIRVTNPGTSTVRFTVYPFGKGYRGQFVISTADVNGDGIADLIVRRPLGHHRFATKIFSGLNGSPLPSNLA